MVCQRDLGGSIDPSPFVDGDGRAYLLWKAEGAGGPPQTLWSQELTADGLGVAGPAWPLLSADRSFEHGVVEAPSMVREGGDLRPRLRRRRLELPPVRDGLRHLRRAGRTLHQAGRRAGADRRGRGWPVPAASSCSAVGDGALWAAFHAFSEPNVSYPSSRYLHVARARVEGGRLVIDAET